MQEELVPPVQRWGVLAESSVRPLVSEGGWAAPPPKPRRLENGQGALPAARHAQGPSGLGVPGSKMGTRAPPPPGAA